MIIIIIIIMIITIIIIIMIIIIIIIMIMIIIIIIIIIMIIIIIIIIIIIVYTGSFTVRSSRCANLNVYYLFTISKSYLVLFWYGKCFPSIFKPFSRPFIETLYFDVFSTITRQPSF